MKTKSTLFAAVLIFFGFTAFAQNEKLIAENNSKVVFVPSELLEAHNLTLDQLRSMQLSDESLVVLDTRSRDAFDAGTIKNAKFIGDDLNIEKIWMLHRDASIVIFGNDAQKTKEVSSLLLEKGFHNVFYLQSSLSELSKQGIEIRGNAARSDKRAKNSK
jgi:rhodanese-related sulfurtransferase